MVYNRWGRVGVKGQTKLHGPFTSQQAAIVEFESKFFNKTNNYWSNRKDFVCYPRCYAWLEMDYDEKEKESDVSCFDPQIDDLLAPAPPPSISPFLIYLNA